MGAAAALPEEREKKNAACKCELEKKSPFILVGSDTEMDRVPSSTFF